MKKNYTEEQIKDIEEREKKCLDFLKENHMTPACQITKSNMGNDLFADKLTPYLQDILYSPQVSPIQKDDVKP